MFRFSWATSAIFTLLVMNLSTLIGEFLRLIDNGAAAANCSTPETGDDKCDKNTNTNSSDSCRLQQQQQQQQQGLRKVVLKTSAAAIAVATLVLAVAGLIVTLLTQGMDWRAISILEGLSRLEAAVVLFLISVRTLQWTGIYHSPTRTNPRLWSMHFFNYTVQELQDNVSVLRYHVVKSVVEEFGIIFFLLLPFVGRPISFVAGVLMGVFIDACVYFARRSSEPKSSLIAHAVALGLALSSTALFTSGCHYIQTVWQIYLVKSKSGLAVVACAVWLATLAFTHWCFRRDAKARMIHDDRRLSMGARQERRAFSIVFSMVDNPLFRISEVDSRFETVSDIDEEEEEEEEKPDPLMSTDEQKSFPSSVAQDDEYYSNLMAQETTGFQNIWWVVTRSLYALTLGVSIFIVVVNIGATHQMNVVRDKFPAVHEHLYSHMNEGAVCAMHLDTHEVKTFEDKDAAHDAGDDGWKIAHCGACGACSNWHNLRLEYTTRAFLASESARCARKSLWWNGREAVSQCLQEEPIGFQLECCECWTRDIYCSRAHCAFLFLQSTLINKVSHFEVSENAITSATCEEAMCEMDFVPCSGANRRRMNILSDIERPKNEQCNSVEFDWEELFVYDSGNVTNPKYADDSLSISDGAGEILGRSKEELWIANMHEATHHLLQVLAGIAGLLIVIALWSSQIRRTQQDHQFLSSASDCYETTQEGSASGEMAVLLASATSRPEDSYKSIRARVVQEGDS